MVVDRLILDTRYVVRIEVENSNSIMVISIMELLLNSFEVLRLKGNIILATILVLEDAAYSGSAYNSTRTIISMPNSQNGDAAMYFDNVAIGYVNK